MENVQFEEKRITGNVTELSPMFKKIKKKILKKSQMLNRMKKMVASRQDPTQLRFQLVKRN